jgi:hypothetical protein
MKIAELLRRVADAVEQEQDPGRPDDSVQNPAALSPINVGLEVDTPDNQDSGVDDDLFVPPLQLKMELLKRAVDVDNIYDAGEPRADQAHENQQNELAMLRRNAGIPVAAVMELDNEELTDD